MKYKWNDTPDHLQTIRDMGIDRFKLEEACELAAMKVYPVYAAFNYEMGDRTPSLQYVQQIIFELAAGQIAAGASDTYSWGGIVLDTSDLADEGEDPDIRGINIGFHLKSVSYDDIKLNN
jgi:hypothetical protein